MKLSALLTTILVSVSGFAFQDGTYNCGSRENFQENIYKVKTLTIDGIQLPHLDVTRHFYKDPNDPKSEDRTYHVQGIANHYTDNNTHEVLMLGNMTIELESGKINCKK